MLNISFSKIISSKNNIYYADYLMKYKVPKKFKSKSGYGSRRHNTYQFKNFKKKKAKRTIWTSKKQPQRLAFDRKGVNR